MEDAVLLGIVKMHGNCLNYNYKTGLIANGMPVWLYAEDNQIVATRQLPARTMELPAIREMKYYGPQKHIGFPVYLLRASGLCNGDDVGIFQQGEDVVFRKALLSEYDEVTQRKRRHIPAVDGEVRNGRVIRFASETKARLGLTRNCWIHIRANLVDGCWLEMTKKQPGTQLPTLKQLGNSKQIARFLHSGKAEYQVRYTDSINLPAEFLRESGLMEATQGTVQLPCWIDSNGWFILEGRPICCDCCGREIRRYQHNCSTLLLCGACCQREVDLQ